MTIPSKIYEGVVCENEHSSVFNKYLTVNTFTKDESYQAFAPGVSAAHQQPVGCRQQG